MPKTWADIMSQGPDEDTMRYENERIAINQGYRLSVDLFAKLSTFSSDDVLKMAELIKVAYSKDLENCLREYLVNIGDKSGRNSAKTISPEILRPS